MKWIVSRYEHKISYIKDYTDDVVLYDRSHKPVSNAIVVLNIGSDVYDKFSYIIDNYDNLPNVAVYTKANLFDYIKPREFEKIKDNKTFTPILTQEHHTYSDGLGPVCWYENGMYCERKGIWDWKGKYVKEVLEFFKKDDKDYYMFAPGSNYILPKENILKYPKSVYEQLRNYLAYDVYPAEAQIIERNLYNLWRM